MATFYITPTLDLIYGSGLPAETAIAFQYTATAPLPRVYQTDECGNLEARPAGELTGRFYDEAFEFGWSGGSYAASSTIKIPEGSTPASCEPSESVPEPGMAIALIFVAAMAALWRRR